MNFDDEEAQFAEAIRRSLQESLITPSNPSPASYPPPAVEPPRLVSPQPTTKPQVIDLTDDDIPIKVEKGSKPAQEDLRIPSLNNSRTQTHSVTNNPGSSNVNSTNNNSNNRVNSSAHSMPISHASDVTNGYTRDLLNNHANDLLNSYARDYYNNHAKETGEDEETPSRNTRNIASDYEDHLMDNYERTLLSNFERDAINKYNTFNNFADDIMNNHEDTINDDMDDESDEDMKRALALSLAEISTQHTPEPMTAESRTVTPDVASPLLSLNREQMEKERLERIKKRALSTSKAEAGRQHADEPKRQRRKEAELAITPPASVPEPTFALASSSSIPATSQASKPKPSAEINPDSAHIPTLESTPGLLKPKVTPRRAKTAVPRKPRSLPKAPASASEIPSSPIKSTPKSPLYSSTTPEPKALLSPTRPSSSISPSGAHIPMTSPSFSRFPGAMSPHRGSPSIREERPPVPITANSASASWQFERLGRAKQEPPTASIPPNIESASWQHEIFPPIKQEPSTAPNKTPNSASKSALTSASTSTSASVKSGSSPSIKLERQTVPTQSNISSPLSSSAKSENYPSIKPERPAVPSYPNLSSSSSVRTDSKGVFLPRFNVATFRNTSITGKVPGHFEIQFNDLVVKEHIVKAVLTAFEVDEEWLEQQLPHNITQCIVRNWHREAGDKPGICTAGKVVFVHPPLSGMGTFHTKLMMLFYPTFCRVVVTSANLVPHDWEQLVNTVYVQDFAMLPAAVQTPEQLGDFGSTLYNYLKVMTLPDKILSVIKAVDFSTAKVLLVPTVQGSYLVNSQHTYGIAQLSKVLQARGLQGKELEVEYQTSSLGKLTLRFLDEFYRAARGLHVRARSRFADEERLPPIKVVFPTERHVHGSRLREDGAGTICLQSQFWEHPTFPRRVMHDFECAGSLKGSLMHSKIVLAKVSDQPSNATTYIPVPGSVIPRQEAISNCVGWFYVGSANFTESAWGTVTNKRATAKNVNGIHINMRNWELGVVYIIETEDEMHDLAAISAAQRLDPSGELSFFGPLPVPYMRPLTQYNDRDKPWIR